MPEGMEKEHLQGRYTGLRITALLLPEPSLTGHA